MTTGTASGTELYAITLRVNPQNHQNIQRLLNGVEQAIANVGGVPYPDCSFAYGNAKFEIIAQFPSFTAVQRAAHTLQVQGWGPVEVEPVMQLDQHMSNVIEPSQQATQTATKA